jgi:hypothetical protein
MPNMKILRFTNVATFAFIVSFMAAATPACAEEEMEFEVMDAGHSGDFSGDALTKNDENRARIERLLSIPLPRTSRAGALSYLIEHRTSEPVDKDPFHNFLGFDSGEVKIGFGLLYGVTDWMDISAYRNNGTVETFDTYQFTGRAQFLDETKDQFMDAAVIFGGSLFTIRGSDDVWANLGYGLFGKTILDRLYISSGAIYHEDSTARDKTAADRNESTAILGGAHWRATDGILLTGEYSVPVDGYEAKSMAWAGGIKFVTHRHTFALIAGNTQYMGLDGFAAGTSSKSSDVQVGFAITREFNL